MSVPSHESSTESLLHDNQTTPAERKGEVDPDKEVEDDDLMEVPLDDENVEEEDVEDGGMGEEEEEGDVFEDHDSIVMEDEDEVRKQMIHSPEASDNDVELNNLMTYANSKERLSVGRTDLDRRGAMKRTTAPSSVIDSLENVNSTDTECQFAQKWSIRAQPRFERLTTAVLHDDRASISAYLDVHLSYKMRGLNIPVEIKSRANHIIRSKAMSLGHLLVLFATPRTLAYLEARKQLVNSLFRTRCDFDVDFVAMDTKLSLQPSYEFRDSFKGVPSAFMAALRDNWPSLKWLIRKRYFRQHAVETDSTGRNILHIAVEEESPNLLKEILNNRSVFPIEILRNMLKMRDTIKDETPFTRASSRPDPSMMLTFVRFCSPDFVMGREDLTGIGKTVFNFVLSKLTNTTLSTQLVREFLKRGSIPDHSTFDDTSSIESLIQNEQFAGNELKRMVRLLLKYGAQPTNGALIKLLRLSFRTDSELFELSKILLKHGGTRLLLSKQAYVIWSIHRRDTRQFHPFELASRDGKSVCIEILRNSTVTIAKMERLLTLISNYANISAMFPDADGIAVAIGERMGLEPSDENYLDLESVLRLILRFVLSHPMEEELRAFLNRLQWGILRELFERFDFSRADHGTDASTAFVLRCLDVMETLEFDFNSLVDGQVGLFSVFHTNVPDEVVMKVLEALPKSFQINTQDAMSENIGSLVIKRYSENFQTVRKVCELLKSLDFDFKQLIHGGQTLLMLYVSKCGERFDQMQTQDRMTSYVENDFFSVIRFLFREKIDMQYQVAPDDFNSSTVMNVLSVSMSLTHSNIAEEILKLNPSLLEVVPVETVLAFIKQCPQVLEFLNGRSLLGDIRNCPDSDQPHHEHEHTGRSFLKKNYTESTSLDIRTVWLQYVRKHHEDILKFVGEEEQTDFSKQVELIYDYLVHCDFPDEEKMDMLPATVAMEFSVFRLPVPEALHDDSEYYDPKKRKEMLKAAMKERVNGSLFLKIVEECSTIVSHPLFTEYFENFYRKAFFNSVAFLLFHMLFLAILTSSLNYVETPVSLRVNDTNYYQCTAQGIDSCNPLYIQQKNTTYLHVKCLSFIQNNCSSCTIHCIKEDYCKGMSNVQATKCPFEVHERDKWGSGKGKVKSITICLYILMAMGLIGLVRECVQMMLDRMDYLKSYMQNFVEVSMYVFVLLFAYNFSECDWSTGYKETWQYQLGTFAVLNSWFMMFFYMSKFPAFATYVIMFYQSVKSGLWLIITFSSLILGFACSFHFLLRNQTLYSTMPLSINKIWIMMAGEIDYKATFMGEVPFDFMTRILLFVFVLLISIVLANLFIGLIVGDVEKINKEAELKKWQWNLEFIIYTESMFDFLEKWGDRFRHWCQRKKKFRTIGQREKDRRSTVYLQQVDSGRRRLGAVESSEHGLHVTDLSWRNGFKWTPIAKFFGFVDRKELAKRLMAVETRKLKLRKQYSALKRASPQQNKKISEPEGPVKKKLVVEPVHKEPEEESEPESGVTISVEPEKLKKQKSETTEMMGSTDSLASVEELLPRHEREPQRVTGSRQDFSRGDNDNPQTVMEAAARLGYMQFSLPGKAPRFLRVSQSHDIFGGSSR